LTAEPVAHKLTKEEAMAVAPWHLLQDEAERYQKHATILMMLGTLLEEYYRNRIAPVVSKEEIATWLQRHEDCWTRP
jgi:hypothetical protein